MVPESLIHDSIATAKSSGEEKDVVNFKKVLKVGQKFKDAEMHPMYLFDHTDYTIIVVAEETFGKKLH
jgi:hypothetical protein